MTPENSERNDRYGKRDGPRKPYGDRGQGDRRPYNGKGHGDKRPYDKGRRDGGYRPRDRDGSGRDDRGDRRPYNGGNRGGYRGPGRDDHGSRGDGDKRPYDKGRRDGGYRPRDRDGSGRDDRGDRRPYNGGDRRDGGYGKKDDRRPGRDFHGPGKGRRDGGRDSRGNDRRSYDKGRRDRDDRRGNGRPRDDRGRREERDDVEARAEHETERVLTVPSTAQKILFKGVDCEVNGRTDLAMYLYLHGALMLSGGCEKNAVRMLREMGPGQYSTVRGRVAKECPEEALVAFDYLCSTVDGDYDRTFLRTAAENGDAYAIYCRIRLEEIEGDDPCIDVFASSMATDEKMVEDGLKLLIRKKDSVRAERCLGKLKDRRELRQSIRPAFVRSMKGDEQSLRTLEKLSSDFPEARFLKGFVESEDRLAYAEAGMADNSAVLLSFAPELGLKDTAFGRFLSAKKAQMDGNDWIPQMIESAADGCEYALQELLPAQSRKDVRRGLSAAYMARGDVAGMVKYYDGEDSTYLDRYCAGSSRRIIEVGRLMGDARRIDWLKRNALDGKTECVDELREMASSEDHRSKQLVYALHDVGADLDSARLYFDMYGDKTLPSVKWLAKVCSDEEANEYVRSRFEEMGEASTYESIFVDDGYENRKGRGGRGRR